jgi:predicted ATPase/DNA-binding CsgD family transcriptional regulator
MADRSGQQLGNYRLLRLLGQGGFAEVYLGQHTYLNRLAALKVLQLVLNDEDIERFVKEARILASLNHPHIVRVLDFAVEQGIPFLVMEYIANGNLRERYPQGTRVPNEEIISYVQQIASALQYAHDLHLIHRDIKPENILLGSGGEVLLSDFGLAILAPSSVDLSTRAIEPAMVGTTPYLAPEQLRGDAQVASDQYALGIVVYEWLCGKRPFHGSSIEIVAQHLTMLPPPLRDQLADIPPLVEEVVLKAIAKDPQRRFANVQDFANALENAFKATQPPYASYSTNSTSVMLQGMLKPEPILNLPATFTPLIGRERDIADICTVLEREDVRLLTLLGTGGIGKTRLSIEVGRVMQAYFTDGVCYVHLTAIEEPEQVIPAIAQALGIQELGVQSILGEVKKTLREKQLLLILDNFEQVVSAALLLEELLIACTRLKIVVTSREVLHLEAEHLYLVPPLGLPDLNRLPEAEMLTRYSAITLFVQRAQASLPTFQLTQSNAQTVAGICVRLDGSPLAIELASARVKLLTPQSLLARLSQPFQILTSTSRTLPSRHQTLLNALQWSYDLLNAEEQRLFRRLSIFSDSWTLEAVETIENELNEGVISSFSVLDTMTSLLEKSLLVQSEHEGEEPRFRMLQTVREFAHDLLSENGELEKSQRVHAFYYLTLVEDAENQLKGIQQTPWLARLELERENLRVALEWALEDNDVGVEIALRLAGTLWRFWWEKGHLSEGRYYLERALKKSGRVGTRTSNRAKALNAAGMLAAFQGSYAEAEQLCGEGLVIFRELDNKQGIATTLYLQGQLAVWRSDYGVAHALSEEALAIFRELEDKWGIASSLDTLSTLALNQGDYLRAYSLAEEGLALSREIGNSGGIAHSLWLLAVLIFFQGDHVRAHALLQESLTIAREVNDKRAIADALVILGYVAFFQGGYDAMRSPLEQGLLLHREVGDQRGIAMALYGLGWLALGQGDYGTARSFYEESLNVFRRLGHQWFSANCLEGLAAVVAIQGLCEWAARLCGVAQTIRETIHASRPPIGQIIFDRAVDTASAKLGEEAFAKAFSEGKSMTVEEVLITRGPLAESKKDSTIHQHSRSALTLANENPDGLTPREIEVLCLIAKGLNASQVADQLVISQRTVTSHLSSIYGKINVSTRAAAVRYAIEHGMA